MKHNSRARRLLRLDGSWAYTTSFQDAARIRRKRGRPFVFSTSNPEKSAKSSPI